MGTSPFSEYIQAIINTAPPLTDDKRDQLTMLFTSPQGGDEQ